MTTESEIDRLYTLPLSEFTAARNELAKRLRARGDRSAADEVKALAKPSVAAWAVNQLFHREREAFDRLLAAGAAQRRAVTRRGEVSRAAGERKRAALNRLLRRAEALLEKGGSRWTPALRQRVARTLESVAAQPPGSETRPGRLSADLQPSGFDALLGASISAPAAAAAKRGRARSKSKRPSAAAARRLEAVRARVEAIRRELAAERRKKSAAAKALAGLERQAAAARKRSRAADRRAEEARRKADELELRARRASKALEDAVRTVARTEGRLETETRKADDLATP